MTTRTSFGLSRWSATGDGDESAGWQAQVDAEPIGGGGRDLALEAAVDVLERVVCRPVGHVFRSDVASGSSTSDRAAGATAGVGAAAGRENAAVDGVVWNPKNNVRLRELVLTLAYPVRLPGGAPAPA